MDPVMVPLVGYDPEIGRWLWGLEETRRRTLRLLEGIDQRTLDWEGPDSRENAIGTLLYHIADAELSWLYENMLGRDDPPVVQADFPIPSRDKHGRLSRVLAVPLEEHLALLGRCRRRFLEEFQAISLEQWRTPRPPGSDRRDGHTRVGCLSPYQSRSGARHAD